MNRTGLYIALALAAVIGIVFAVFPQLDLAISRPYHVYEISGLKFALRFDPMRLFVRDAMLWLVTGMAGIVLVVLAIKLVFPRRKLIAPARAILFLLVTITLAPGVLTNLTLKEHWSRPRPIQVTEFGGTQHFRPWWDPRGDCPTNCAFVSGDVSSAFWTLAPAALVPPPWQALAYGASLAFGAIMAWLRIAAGGHFFTDVAFAGLFTFFIVWIAYALIYRWPRTRLSEEKLERMIERIAAPAHKFFARLFGSKSDS